MSPVNKILGSSTAWLGAIATAFAALSAVPGISPWVAGLSVIAYGIKEGFGKLADGNTDAASVQADAHIRAASVAKATSTTAPLLLALLALCTFTPKAHAQSFDTGWREMLNGDVSVPLGIEPCDDVSYAVTTEMRYGFDCTAYEAAPSYVFRAGLHFQTNCYGVSVAGDLGSNACGGAIEAGETHTVRVDTGPISWRFNHVSIGDTLTMHWYGSMQEWGGEPVFGHDYAWQWQWRRAYARVRGTRVFD